MARGPQTFKQADLTRALKGAKAAGVEVCRVKIGKDGTIEIDVGDTAKQASSEAAAADEWDAALK